MDKVQKDDNNHVDLMRMMMERMLLKRYKVVIVIASLFLEGFFFIAGAHCADRPEAARSVSQIESTVIHVDQYAVYIPNHVLYFDTQMDRQKAASLARIANQLRNKKAVITYSAVGDISQDRHALLVDIVSADRYSAEKTQRETAGAEKTQREAPKAAGEARENRAGEMAKAESAAVGPGEFLGSQEQTAGHDEPPAQKPVRSGRTAITRDEATAFVRRLLDLNEKKDLPAIMEGYGDQVDYYDRGVISKDSVRRDLGYYFRNWERIKTTLDGDVVMIVLDPDVRTIKFTTSFAVRNDRKALAGKTENIWKIQRINGQLKLVDVKQKVISREAPGF